MNVVSQAALGALAGAAGTAALDVVTYADMALRGRPPSGLPDKMARKLADLAGCEEFAKPADQLSDRMKQRRAGIAAMLGYAAVLGRHRRGCARNDYERGRGNGAGPDRSTEMAVLELGRRHRPALRLRLD